MLRQRLSLLTIGGVLVIALGAAATSAMATLINATLLASPFEGADRLVRVWWTTRETPRVSMSIPELRDLKDVASFDVVLGSARMRTVAYLGDGAERLRVEAVSANYFETLGVRPSVGRLIDATSHAPGAAPVAVLSYGTWQRHFGGRTDMLGQPLRTNTGVFTVVGVAPQSFGGLVEDDVIDLWVPLEAYQPARLMSSRDERQSWVVARLRSGQTPAILKSQLSVLERSLKSAYPDIYRDMSLTSEPFGENWRADLRRGSLVLAVSAGLLLLIAAANLACLLLVRVISRRHELALMSALGADRARIAWQLAAEAGAIVVAGGALGVAAGGPVLKAFLSLSPVPLPAYLVVEPNVVVILLSAAALGVAGLVAGVAPAIAGARVDPADVLRESGRGKIGTGRERHWTRWLIAAETALTVALMIVAALLVRSQSRLETLDLGYSREGMARLGVTINTDDAGGSLTAFYARLTDELKSQPGISSVGLVAPTLPPWDGSRGRVRMVGGEANAGAQLDGVASGVHYVDAALLSTLGISVVSGRGFDARDDRDAVPGAIISRSLARTLAGDGDSIGRVIQVNEGATGWGTPNAANDLVRTVRVVGVAENVAYDGIGEQGTRRYIQYQNGADPKAARHDVYLPLNRWPSAVVSIGARTNGDAAAAVDQLRRTIGRIAPRSAVHWTGTMAGEVALEYAPTRFYSTLAAAFSLSALLVTVIGLFALLSHSATTRAAEMGLRRALGARSSHLVTALAAHDIAPVLMGVAVGVALAAAAARLLGTVVYGTASIDIPSTLMASAVFLLASVIALAGPAWRAASVDPMSVLKR